MKLKIEISDERASELLENGIAGMSEEAKNRVRSQGTLSREVIRGQIDRILNP
jgi:hypothetical protein